MEIGRHSLTYQPKTANHRRLWRWGVVLLAVTAALLSWENRATFKRAVASARERRIVWQCENYQLPPGTVVYETDPQLAAAYRGNPLYEWVNVNPPYLIRHVPAVDDLEAAQGYTNTSPNAVFCHSLTSRAGHRRLVIVNGFDAGRPDASVDDPGSLFFPSIAISTSGTNFPRPWSRYEVLTQRGTFFASFAWDWKNNPAFTLYAGQPDPKDLSHFTFRYTGKTGAGIIDGWLLDNDKVRFRALDGPYGHPLSYFTQLEKEFDD